MKIQIFFAGKGPLERIETLRRFNPVGTLSMEHLEGEELPFGYHNSSEFSEPPTFSNRSAFMSTRNFPTSKHSPGQRTPKSYR